MTRMNESYLTKFLLPLEQESNTEIEKDDEKELNRYFLAQGESTNNQFHQASVLLPIIQNLATNEWELLLTKRAAHLKHHPGEISFPGGRFEEHDQNLQATAVRETYEEIGIHKHQIKLIGKLPKQKTISRYHVTPFVGIIDAAYQLRLDKNEVEEAFVVPLNFVLNSSNQQKVERKINNQSLSYYVIKYNGYNIWGATAKMLVNFGRLLNT